MAWHWLHPLAAAGSHGAAGVAWAVLVALAVDRFWGEPPARWHPVVWMGKALALCGARIAPSTEAGPKFKPFWFAALAWSALAALVWIAFSALQALLSWPPGSSDGLRSAWRPLLAATVLGVLLKPLLALAMLQSETSGVEAALDGSLQAGRAQLARLVSRDVAQLSEAEVRQSAIESLAENLNDSLVAPLFWFALAGLPGAALYRLANTADAMWGYPGMRGGRCWEWAGKWAARADDVLSWLPARLTALLIALVAGGVPAGRLAREARKTPSPNSGWPMAAMALGLGIQLTKPGVYQLNPTGRAPGRAEAGAAQRVAARLSLALVLLAAAIMVAGVLGAVE